ncbi:4751_t:CDS:2 [Entrophospora sp. SA101]|nr:4751_t:CDS:2 [Entrophospora sp. SA101]
MDYDQQHVQQQQKVEEVVMTVKGKQPAYFPSLPTSTATKSDNNSNDSGPSSGSREESSSHSSRSKISLRINSIKKKNILSDLVKSFCDLNNFKLPSDPKVLETILLQPFCIKIPIESEVYEQWKREIIDINIDNYFVNGDLSGSTAAEFSAECVHALPRTMEAIDINRNVKDPSEITIDSLQPDVLVWVQDALVFKAEEKKDGDFNVVMEELRDKMKDWNLASCGNLPYLLSYGAVKENFQFFAITKDSNLMSISPRYNISTFAGGFKVLISTLNMFKCFLAAATLLPEVPFPFLKTFNRQSGASITFVSSDHIQKKIKNFEDYIYSDIETLQEVYKIIESCEYTVKAFSMPEVLVKKHIQELKTAIYQILKVLEIVYDSGYVHRDLSWENIWKDSHGRFIVGDWEHSGRLDNIPKFVIQWWAPELHNTPTSPYTDKADIYLVGNLLNTLDVLLSNEAVAFCSLLMKNNPNERPSAVNALQHQWFNKEIKNALFIALYST